MTPRAVRTDSRRRWISGTAGDLRTAPGQRSQREGGIPGLKRVCGVAGISAQPREESRPVGAGMRPAGRRDLSVANGRRHQPTSQSERLPTRDRSPFRGRALRILRSRPRWRHMRRRLRSGHFPLDLCTSSSPAAVLTVPCARQRIWLQWRTRGTSDWPGEEPACGPPCP